MTKSRHNHPDTAIVFLSPVLEIGFGDSKLGVAKVNLSLNEKLVANDPGFLCSPVFVLKRLDIRDPAFLAGITSVFICILSSVFSDAKHYVISCGVSCHHSEMFPIYIKGLFFYPISNCLDRLKSLSA